MVLQMRASVHFVLYDVTASVYSCLCGRCKGSFVENFPLHGVKTVLEYHRPTLATPIPALISLWVCMQVSNFKFGQTSSTIQQRVLFSLCKVKTTATEILSQLIPFGCHHKTKQQRLKLWPNCDTNELKV